MAHTACVIDQYVVIFGGLNSNTTTLVSNDLYVLSLDGNTNAILPDTNQNRKARSNAENSSTINSNIQDTNGNFKPHVQKLSKEALEV